MERHLFGPFRPVFTFKILTDTNVIDFYLSLLLYFEAVFMKRKESGLWIQSFGLNFSSFICSVTLDKLFHLPEPWLFSAAKIELTRFLLLSWSYHVIQSSVEQIVVKRGWPVCNVRSALASRSRVILDGLWQKWASSTPHQSLPNMSFPF